MFGSDDEAYTAAAAAYEKYLLIYASIGADGGARSDRILDVAGTEHANQLLEEFRSMSDAGVHTTGTTELLSARLFKIDEARERLELQVCLGVGTSRVIDAAGNDVTSERDPVVPLLVSFDAKSSESISITGSVVWSGDSFC
jgi:succinate dehydrogenase/fumarate reductase flavoprotein subunit